MVLNYETGADPELLLGGGANPWGGRLPNILVIFSEKSHEIKEILVRGGGGRPPPNPPEIIHLRNLIRATHVPNLFTSLRKHFTDKLTLLTTDFLAQPASPSGSSKKNAGICEITCYCIFHFVVVFFCCFCCFCCYCGCCLVDFTCCAFIDLTQH